MNCPLLYYITFWAPVQYLTLTTTSHILIHQLYSVTDAIITINQKGFGSTSEIYVIFQPHPLNVPIILRNVVLRPMCVFHLLRTENRSNQSQFAIYLILFGGSYE